MKRRLHYSIILESIILILLAYKPDPLFSQESNENMLIQYLFTSFTKGKIVMKTGDPKSIMLNYNTLSEKLVFEQSGKYYDLSNQNMVDTAYIEDKKLVPHKEFFLEVVIRDTISFFVQHKSSLQERGKDAGYGTFSTTSAIDSYSGIASSSGFYNLTIPDYYIIKHSQIFWIKTGNNWSTFYNEKQFLKIFPDHSAVLKKYIKENKLKTYRIEDVVQLVVYLNDLERSKK